MSTKKLPERLYKYRAFGGQTLELLIADQLYFADPSTFNDPLDTNPSLEIDIEPDELEKILGDLVERRITAEMTAAAKSIKYKGPKTLDHIDRQSRLRVKRLIAEIRYDATNPHYEIDDPLKSLLGQYVEEEVLRRYDRGIVSLAGISDCPLMWSHYADKHRGISVGYSVPADAAHNLHKISYGGSRLVKASEISAMLDGNESARREVDKAVLLKKARDWRYEREWRLIGERGLQDSSLELEELVFGMLCPVELRFTIVKALEDRCRGVKFYEIIQQPGSFDLRKIDFEMHEAFGQLPRRAHSSGEGFKDIPIPDGS